MRILVIGVNGFIGHALARRILSTTPWSVVGIDIESDRLSPSILHGSRFEFMPGDITVNREWVTFQIKRCDVVVPLAAVAVPKIYMENPLLVFQLDFMENLRIIQLAAKYRKRLVFPSTSEVYGMANDEEFDEQATNLVLGPIDKHRWIYSCAKQLLDRVIHAEGLQRGLRYSLFRPFNWIGPGLDRMYQHKIGNSRVVTQFIADIAFNRPIQLVDGGRQRRCFLYIDDGVDGIMRILTNEGGRAERQIFNLGNPTNETSMGELAERLIALYGQHPRAAQFPFTSGIVECTSEEFYGSGYQDVSSRRPSIRRARELLGWAPSWPLHESLKGTMEWFLEYGLPAEQEA